MIIAIVPAPGHEHLVAEGPLRERPALLMWCSAALERHGDPGIEEEAARSPKCCAARAWRPGGNCAKCGRSLVLRRRPGDASLFALVLHAPGGPRLGMVRAMEAAGIGKILGATAYKGRLDIAWYDTDSAYGQRLDIPCPSEWDGAVLYPLALAHLLVQRGIAAEVIVLPSEAK